MKKIVKNLFTFICSIIGFFGGVIWLLYFSGEAEAIILTAISAVEIISYLLVPNTSEPESSYSSSIGNVTTSANNNQNVSVNLNFSSKEEPRGTSSLSFDRNAILELQKSRIKILFIDDDKNFNVVKILKDSGWKNTKTVTDLKTLDVQVAKESEIIFVDINGVGLFLKLRFEGLDLALMLKQRYPEKKIIIYSANKNSNSFHEAWDICDYKLEKNALPYQFQNLVEEYSIEIYKSK